MLDWIFGICLIWWSYVLVYCWFQLNRVKAVEKEKDDLEGSKNEAVEYLSMENEIVHLKNKIYQKYV